MILYEVICRNGYDYQLVFTTNSLMMAAVCRWRVMIKEHLDPDHCVIAARHRLADSKMVIGEVIDENEVNYLNGPAGA